MFITDIAVAASLVITVFLIILCTLAFTRTKMRRLVAPIILAMVLASFQTVYLLSSVYRIGFRMYNQPIFFLFALLAPAIALIPVILAKGR